MTDDPWQTALVDVDDYLQRVGVERRRPCRALLDELLAAHIRTFTFDNIDVVLNQHRGVGLDAIADKFVGRGRGGYCFEHASLFAAVLERLGFSVRRQLGRVAVAGGVNARTHLTVVITLEGDELLADPGFGMSLLRPIPLLDGATDEFGGWHYRVQRAPIGWELHRLRDGGWQLMHTTDELPVHPVDVEMGHHFTSTFPTSHFRSGLMVGKHLPGRHVTVTDGTVTIRRPAAPTEHRALRSGELSEWLATLAVELTDDEHRRLMERFPTTATAR